MHPSQRDYLTTEVMTATPEKLHLLLVEGALRVAHQADVHLRAGDAMAASEALIRCQQIVAEMVSGLNVEASPELVKKIVAVYLFIYRRLVEANFELCPRKLGDAVRVLKVERETWRMALDRAQKSPAPPLAGPHDTVRLGQSFVA